MELIKSNHSNINFQYPNIFDRASSLNNITSKNDFDHKESEDVLNLKDNAHTTNLIRKAILKVNSNQVLIASPLKKIKQANFTSRRINNSKTILVRNSIFTRRSSIMDEFINMKVELFQSQRNSILKNYSKQTSINHSSQRSSIDLVKNTSSKLSSSKFQTAYKTSVKANNLNTKSAKTINQENSIINQSSINQKYTNTVKSVSDNSIDTQSDINQTNHCYANSNDFRLTIADERLMVKYKRPVYDSLSDDEGLLDSSDNSYIINPTSQYLRCFYYCLLVFLIISSVYTPLRVAQNEYINLFYFICDLIIDVMLLLALALIFNTGFYDIEENLVTNRKRIIVRYLKSWFLLDLIMCLPINSILNFTNYNEYQITRIYTTYAFKANNSPIRMIRLLYVLKLLSDYYLKIEKYVSNLFIKIMLSEAVGMPLLFLTRFLFLIIIYKF